MYNGRAAGFLDRDAVLVRYSLIFTEPISSLHPRLTRPTCLISRDFLSTFYRHPDEEVTRMLRGNMLLWNMEFKLLCCRRVSVCVYVCLPVYHRYNCHMYARA